MEEHSSQNHTPPKTNMSPGLEDGIISSVEMVPFLGDMLVFPGVTWLSNMGVS